MCRTFELLRWTSPQFLLLRQQTCGFSLDSHLMSNIKREARFMKKIMGQHQSKKKAYYFDRVDTAPSNSSGPKPYNRRRMSVLNKLFMKNITEVLATGSTSHTIEGLGVEIGKVSISPDFQIVNVFYVCKRKPRPGNLEKKLADAGYSLRHDLSQLRLMGEVPRVMFVEDKTLQRLDQIEDLLKAADMGSDEPSPEFLEENTSQEEEENLELFNTSQRAYGLNHSKIFEKILAAKKASLSHKRKSNVSTVQEGVPYSPSEGVQLPPATGERRDSPKRLISKFLKENKSGRAASADS